MASFFNKIGQQLKTALSTRPSSPPAIPTSTRHQGQAIEHLAEHWLIQQGLRAHERNYQIRGGEIDLIMWHGECLVFVEVRYRKSAQFGSGAETVTFSKQQKLLHTAQHYLQQRFGAQPPPCRFDVISGQNHPIQFEWIQNAFGE